MASAGLRDRKKASVKAALVEQALRLFATRGFDGVTVDEIAAAAGVSRRSFFRYFPTKEAVVLERREVELASLKALLESPLPGEAPFATIRRALLALSKHHSAERRTILAEQVLVRTTPSLMARDFEVDRAFERALVARLLAEGRHTAAEERRARILAAAVVGAVRVTIEEWSDRGGDLDLRRLGEDALEFLAPLAPQAKREGRRRA